MTSSPISTISYNTDEFLKLTLNGMLKDGTLLYWCYIKHKGDEDDKKDHIHLRVIPNGRIDLSEFGKEFIELVPDNNPLRCLLWRNSEYKNWFLYTVHNPDYLEIHNLIRNQHYTFDDFVSSSSDDTRILYQEAREWFYNSGEMVEKLVQDKLRDGSTLHDIVKSGLIKARDVFKFKQYVSVLQSENNQDRSSMLIKYLQKRLLDNEKVEDIKK